jgi:hypothetical protein
MRNDLTPELRTDKNGVTSTRWVKPDQSSASKGNGLPTPGIKTESLDSKKNRLFDSFDLDRMAGNPAFEKNFRDQLAQMSETTVGAALATLEKHQESPRVNYAVRHSINSWVKNSDKTERDLLLSIRFAGIESFYEKHIKISPLGNPLRAGDVEDGTLSSLAVRNDPDNEQEYQPLVLSEKEADEAVLAGYVNAALDMHKANVSKERHSSTDYWSVFQDHGDLVGVFSEFRDRLDEATEYVYENGDDAGALRQHLRGDHMALAGGAL